MTERVLGEVGTRLLFENDRVKTWELRLAPGEESAAHRHELDHLLIQLSGDRVAVIPEPDTAGPRGDGPQRRRRALPRDHHRAEGLGGRQLVAAHPRGVEAERYAGGEKH